MGTPETLLLIDMQDTPSAHETFDHNLVFFDGLMFTNNSDVFIQ